MTRTSIYLHHISGYQMFLNRRKIQAAKNCLNFALAVAPNPEERGKVLRLLGELDAKMKVGS